MLIVTYNVAFTFLQQPQGFAEVQLVNWVPEDETVPQQSQEPDRDVFGAPKTRAAPAGFIPIDPSEKTLNPKKMSTTERMLYEVSADAMYVECSY